MAEQIQLGAHLKFKEEAAPDQRDEALARYNDRVHSASGRRCSMDPRYCQDRADDALREAAKEALPNVRQKHIAAAEAWQAMAKRIYRVQAASERSAAAKSEIAAVELGGRVSGRSVG